MKHFWSLIWPSGTPLSNKFLVAMPLFALALRCYWIAVSLYPNGESVFDTGFGFGEYTRSLLQDGHFLSCSSLPFVACQPNVCIAASRMPVIPLLYAVLSLVVGTQALWVAVAKCLLLACVTAVFLRLAIRDLKVSPGGVALLCGAYFGLQPLKHGASLAYEEGILLDLSICLCISLIYLVRLDLENLYFRWKFMAIAAILIATTMYFAKTTALFALVVVVLIVVTDRRLGMAVKAASIMLVALPFALWGIHNHASSGATHLSSSWNGENLYRGYNGGAAAIYPQITLDRAFDSKLAVLRNGARVELGEFSAQRCFNSEWAWSDFYAAAARQWIAQHPLAALRFDLTKAWVALVEVRHTPEFLSAIDKTPLYSPAASAVMIVWMVYARALFAVLCFRLLSELRHRSRLRHLWFALLLAAATAPYVVVFGWQRHMVPVLVMAATVLVFLYMAQSRPVHRGDASPPTV